METNQAIEFNQIKKMLADHALSSHAKEKAQSLEPFFSEGECRRKLQETTEAKQVLESIGTPPLAQMQDLKKNLEYMKKDAMLLPEQLAGIAAFLSTCKRMKDYLEKAAYLEVAIAGYGASLDSLRELEEEISSAIRVDRVDDQASPALKRIRREIDLTGDLVKSKLDSMLRTKKNWFADSYVAIRNGRFTLPVKKEYKNQVKGQVVETSNTGGTYFIEPAEVRRFQEKMEQARIEEDNEVRRILYTLTADVDAYSYEIERNRECMETLDFLFAKAKLSVQMGGAPVPVTVERRIRLKQARHPLLDPQICVPLDFAMENGIRGIVITGPNTGGKTVTLKTVGLLSVMAQCGLHVPAEEGSVLSMNSIVLCDIGDGQSITENLSTFSARLKNTVEILERATEESLVLLDELGSGTDPAEGMGLAVAVLEELRQRGCLFIATTHYPEIKNYAQQAENLINARMAFDRDSLKPLYQLQIGEAGESCALLIAKRLGFPPKILSRAYREAYGVPAPPELAEGEKREEPARIRSTGPRLEKEQEKREAAPRYAFRLGDSVTVSPQKELGFVWKPADAKGMVGVQIKGKKQLINHKRLKLELPAEELYPEDYDFSIVFDSVENRKARHKMEKGHQAGVVITHEKEV